MATVKVDSANFQSEVLDSTVPVVVDFWAEWCGPCKMIAPSLEEISNEMEGSVKVAKLNIDENRSLLHSSAFARSRRWRCSRAVPWLISRLALRPRPRCRAGFPAQSPEVSSWRKN
jgi:thiol-disulfide isomerase/thioredoxin